jgi:hypothetical protein
VKELSANRLAIIISVNTLLSALLNDPNFAKPGFSGLKISPGAQRPGGTRSAEGS